MYAWNRSPPPRAHYVPPRGALVGRVQGTVKRRMLKKRHRLRPPPLSESRTAKLQRDGLHTSQHVWVAIPLLCPAGALLLPFPAACAVTTLPVRCYDALQLRCPSTALAFLPCALFSRCPRYASAPVHSGRQPERSNTGCGYISGAMTSSHRTNNVNKWWHYAFRPSVRPSVRGETAPWGPAGPEASGRPASRRSTSQ